MKNEAHLIYSEAPLPENVNHKAVCGKVVHRSKLCFIWDESEMNAPLSFSSRGMCADCYREVPPPGQFLIYGFREGKPNE